MTSQSCFHCGLPAIPGFEAQISGEQQAFCCPGCRAVARLIQDSGLENFYQYRDALPMETPSFFGKDFSDSGDNPFLEKLKIYDDLDYQQDFVRKLDSEEQLASGAHARLHIEGMNCSACAWLIEKRLEKVVAVGEARVNYSQRTLHLQWNPDEALLSDILAQVCALGFKVTVPSEAAKAAALHAENQLFLRRIGVAGIGMMQVGMYAMAGYFGATDAMLGVLRFASLLIATLVIFYAARPFFQGAWRALRHRYLSMDVPVALALGLAYIASIHAAWGSSLGLGLSHTEVYFDAICMFTFFLLVSRYLEFRARSRWQQNSMDSDAGKYALLLSENGEQTTVLSRELQPDERILVKAGEVFPVDIELLSEQAEISQAQLNGEFSPLRKRQGDEISSGSLNTGGPVEARVVRAADESALATIGSLVENAQLHKPRISALADQLSGYFVAAVLMLALTTFVYWWAIDPSRALWIALSVLVVSCPCALSLATPTTLTVLMNHLRTQGVLVRNSRALEKLESIDCVIFDKTGTLTYGQFQLAETEDLSKEGAALQQQRAAALESRSEHPLANAFAHIQQGLTLAEWQMHEGRGVEARVEGVKMRIGDCDFARELVSPDCQVESIAPAKDPDRNNPEHKRLYLANEKGLLAVFALSDQPRPEANQLVRTLVHRLGDKSVVLLSGDPSAQVSRLGRRLGILDTYKGMSAADKLAKLEAVQRQGRTVLAVGDGINDGPILAAADISIAVCNASDISKQTADFVLVTSDLLAVQRLLDCASQGKKIVLQNLAWALTYNLCAIPLAMMGLVPPWLAALGMSASSAVVVLNAFRARRSPKAPGLFDKNMETALQC